MLDLSNPILRKMLRFRCELLQVHCLNHRHLTTWCRVRNEEPVLLFGCGCAFEATRQLVAKSNAWEKFDPKVEEPKDTRCVAEVKCVNCHHINEIKRIMDRDAMVRMFPGGYQSRCMNCRAEFNISWADFQPRVPLHEKEE